MRDVVFSPLSKALVRLFGPAHANHAIALAILVVFLIVGIWHGAGWRYALYGALHAVGVGANHYYTNWLKRRLGKRGYQAYHDNRLIRWSAVAATFLYVTASLFVFANNFDDMQQIFQSLQF
jgi:D-alanyl-lipoteichoic acid acyltransferase DltB (MBOAT superfamily)